MCKRNVSKRTFACGHQLDSLGDLVPDGGCKGCGIEKGRNHSIASSVIPLPCDDCKVAGLWVQNKNGKWYKKSEGEPPEMSPGYKFPYQFSLNVSICL